MVLGTSLGLCWYRLVEDIVEVFRLFEVDNENTDDVKVVSLWILFLLGGNLMFLLTFFNGFRFGDFLVTMVNALSFMSFDLD